MRSITVRDKDFVKKLSLNKKDYLTQHFRLLNAVLPDPIGGKEIETLVNFLLLEVDDRFRFDSRQRRKVREVMGLTPSGISNYIRSLFNKSFLVHVKEEDGRGTYRLNPKFRPDTSQQLYVFMLESTPDEQTSSGAKAKT